MMRNLTSNLAICSYLAVLAGLGHAQMGARRPVTENPLVRNQAAVTAGAQTFKQLCSSCHGPRGEGGQGEGNGPNLVTSWEVRRANDAKLSAIIRSGIPGTGMPPFKLPDEQVTQLAAFVRSLNAPASSTPVPGDIAAGKAVFEGKGRCNQCHMIQGRGGYLGPDLSNVGATVRLDELRKAVASGQGVPGSIYRPVLLQMPGKPPVKGVLRHVSPWSMQILDEKGNIVLLHGDEMKQARLLEKSWMPDDYAKKLSSDELTNVIAYLSRQAVRPLGGKETSSQADSQ